MRDFVQRLAKGWDAGLLLDNISRGGQSGGQAVSAWPTVGHPGCSQDARLVGTGRVARFLDTRTRWRREAGAGCAVCGQPGNPCSKAVHCSLPTRWVVAFSWRLGTARASHGRSAPGPVRSSTHGAQVRRPGWPLIRGTFDTDLRFENSWTPNPWPEPPTEPLIS